MTTTGSEHQTGAVGGALEPAATVYLEALSLYYGTYRAVKDINLVLQPAGHYRHYRPLPGCGKSTVLRAIKEGHIPHRRPRSCRRRRRLRTEHQPVGLRQQVGHRKKAAESVPAEHLRQRCIRAAPVAQTAEIRTGRHGRMGAPAGGSVGRSRGQSRPFRAWACRRSTAAPVHRPARSPRTARSAADGRACSALRPISTLKVEELMQSLKMFNTIIIVTQQMQQAARASDNCFLMNVES